MKFSRLWTSSVGFAAVLLAAFVAGSSTAQTEQASSGAVDMRALTSQALSILKGTCGQCHSPDATVRTQAEYASGPAKGQVLADLAQMLTETTIDFSSLPIVAGDPGASRIIKMIEKPVSKGGMPKPPVTPLSADQVALLRQWIACMPKGYLGEGELTTCAAATEGPAVAAAPSVTETPAAVATPVAETLPSPKFVGLTEVLQAIVNDLETVNEARRGDVRYVTITNLLNAGATSKEMDIFRAGLAKGLNSLSSKANMAKLTPVDEQQTVYRFFLADLGWTSQDWTALMAEYPYAGLPFDDPMTGVATEEAVEQILHFTQTALTGHADQDYRAAQIFARGDWLLRIATHPGRYEKLLRLPTTLAELEGTRLLVDPAANITSEADGTVRGGFPANGQENQSGVSDYSRIIERHALPAIPDGYYWKSFDFGPQNSGRTAIPEHPLQVSELDTPDHNLGFVHDGGEMIFSLPNGLQAYLITTVAGTPLPSAPNNIVNLENDGFAGKANPVRFWEYLTAQLYRNPENGQVLVATDIDIFNGLSCMACHFEGMKPGSDTVGKYFATGVVPAGYTQSDIDRVRSLYNDVLLESWLAQDKVTFARATIAAYRAAGLSEQSPGWGTLVSNDGQLLAGDPVTTLARKYVVDLTLGGAAESAKRVGAEFWMDDATFSKASRASSRPKAAVLFARLDEIGHLVHREDGNINQPDAIGEGPFECQFKLFAEEFRWAGLNDQLISALNGNVDICRIGSQNDAHADPGTPATASAEFAITLGADHITTNELLEFAARVDNKCGPSFFDFPPDHTVSPIPGIAFGEPVPSNGKLVFDTRSSENALKITDSDPRGVHHVGFICTGGAQYEGADLAGLLKDLNAHLSAGQLTGTVNNLAYEFAAYTIH